MRPLWRCDPWAPWRLPVSSLDVGDKGSSGRRPPASSCQEGDRGSRARRPSSLWSGGRRSPRGLTGSWVVGLWVPGPGGLKNGLPARPAARPGSSGASPEGSCCARWVQACLRSEPWGDAPGSGSSVTIVIGCGAPSREWALGSGSPASSSSASSRMECVEVGMVRVAGTLTAAAFRSEALSSRNSRGGNTALANSSFEIIPFWSSSTKLKRF
mmetsp:Transcript_46258/g.104836  ORF Transcript_46258/g.104836 Transcript_46258/m.104836 type:complete len:213 (-) Transcript_46258:636-1274(-)